MHTSSPSDLKARADLAAGYMALGLLESALGITLSQHDAWPVWLLGQLLLCVSMVRWFAILHEAGHNTLFRNRRLNALSGHIASLFTVIPFYTWRSIHALHHRWTGWQDLDPTTEALVPRQLAPIERAIIDLCWRWSIPLFSILYRATNFWNLPRLLRRMPRAHHRRRHIGNIFGLGAIYLTCWLIAGPALMLKTFGLAFLLSLVVYDPILFSQHNHIPQKLSHGEDVSPHAPADQVVFTRSLVFPPLISRYILLNFDAHELHHRYPHIPGYLLDRLPPDEPTPNARDWWQWLRAAKRVPASVIMFKNRDETGLDI